MEIIIRNYRPSDQKLVLEISADTAFFGEAVEAFLDDRALYEDAFARYYTESEPEYLWIAESPDGVIGFLLGCTDTRHQSRCWRRYIVTRVLVNALRGCYQLGSHTASFALGMLIGMVRGEGLKGDLDQYPAHLQIDIKQGYRGYGVGRCLIDAYLDQLRTLEISGVHLETTSHNIAACRLYEKIGFQLLDRHSNRFWSRMLGIKVENRLYGLRL